MEKYYLNRYQKINDTQIMKIENLEDGRTGIILKENIFFPGGGGQDADKGKLYVIKDYNQSYKYELIDIYTNNEGETVNVIDTNQSEIFCEGEKAKQVLDWTHRLDGMQQHSGQHLLSGCFYEKFSRNTKSLHIGNDISQLDIEGEFTQEMIYEIEDMANEIIKESREIKNYKLDREQKSTFTTRRPLPETEDDIRILEIENLDINACCGVHLENTNEIAMIKIVKFYKHKSNTRIEYLAGNRVISYLLNRDRKLKVILDQFKSGEDTIIQTLTNTVQKKERIEESFKNINDKYTNLLINKFEKEIEKSQSGLKILKINLVNEDKNTIYTIANKLQKNEDILIIISNKINKIYNYLIVTEKYTSQKYKIKLKDDFQYMKDKYELKGGGSSFKIEFILENEKNIDNINNYIYYKYWK
ncbi:alanyl-tRNA editing protein [Peptostreptococcus equinus]|uniref:Alanyl-tRNA editing protein n=1 Tax=Peptostreptococcus equinus TaxID=3003601 RepID=A0ABY7JT78_9FIRM|nr:alanyl-tRNA editing protein [Peptostreptococcus sp. CBA3647]WAW15676.1 alanyl-tRNA editing protein [Peptostreptococcus sp. CBA3647]